MVARQPFDTNMNLSFLEEKDKYLASIPTFYQTDEALGTRTSASKILEEEGIGSAKDVLQGLNVPSAREIIESEFAPKAPAMPQAPTPTIPGAIGQTGTLLDKEKKPPTPQADQKTLDAIKEIETKIQTLQASRPKTQGEIEEKANIPFYHEQLGQLKQKQKEEELGKLTLDQKIEKAKSINAPYYTYFNETDYADYELRQNMEYKKSQDALLKRQQDEAAQKTEDELLRKEQEFIKNFNATTPTKPNVIQSPKYGALSFETKQADVGETLKAGSSGFDRTNEQAMQYARQPDLILNIPEAQRTWGERKAVDKMAIDKEKDAALKELQARWQSNSISQEDYQAQTTKIAQDFNKRERELNDRYNKIWQEEKNKTSGETTFTYNLVSQDGAKKQNYVFLPESFALTGTDGPGGYHFNTAFLNKETWQKLFEQSQPIDLDGVGVKAGETALGRGFLFKPEEWADFKKNNLDNNFKINTYTNPLLPSQPILGIGNVNGNLVYVRQSGYKVGRDVITSAYIDNTGTAKLTYKEDYKGVRGFVQDRVEDFAKIPFAPEIVGLATGNPALYASLKGLQTVGMGGDLGDAFKSMAVAYVSASVAAELPSYGKALGSNIATTTGMSATAANFAGGAIVGAAFNGTMAAVTGGDVEKAMLAGAVGGGAQATAADFTNAVFGGETNVETLASVTNLSKTQFQNIFTGAVASGTIAEAVYGRDFVDAFTTSLVTNGVSTAAANTVAKSLDKNLSLQARRTIVQGTQAYVAATARAAIRGEDIQTAIKNVTPEYISKVIGAGIKEAIKGT
jgi:hypothetical protein